MKMKKKNFLKRRSNRKFLYELKKRRWKKKRFFKNLPDKVRADRNRNFLRNSQTSKHELINISGSFSFLEDPLKTINIFKKIKNLLAKGIPVQLDLRDVSSMGIETLTYYCAFFNEKNLTRGTALRGNIPKSPDLRRMFEKSGFLDNVPSNYRDDTEKDIYSRLIHRITKKRVESEIATNVCISSANHVYGADSKLVIQKFRPIIVECMANTWNHAGGNEEKKYNWWLLAYNDPHLKITKFCFLDLGIGIFTSLSRGYQSRNLPRLLKWIVPGDNVKTLQGIFTHGEKRTGTVNLQGRGEGLNYIYSSVKSNPDIKRFTLISNDVEAKIGYNLKDQIQKIDANFDGTMYYWELSQ
jgi:hypothetical protein